MTEHSEPQRLLDDPGVGEALRGDLAVANATTPVTYSVEAGLARFQARVAAGGAEAATAAAATSGLSIFGGNTGIVAGIAGLLLAGGVTVFLLGGEDESVETDRAAVATVVDAVPAEPEPEAQAEPAALAPEEEAEPVLEPQPTDPVDEPVLNSAVELVAPEKAPAAKPMHRKRAASDDSSSVLEEAKKVQQAKKTLEADPNKTLRLLNAIDREFPKGQLMEERAGLRVLALLRAGRVDEGKRRADKYLARYPKGTLANRVRRALSELP